MAEDCAGDISSREAREILIQDREAALVSCRVENRSRDAAVALPGRGHGCCHTVAVSFEGPHDHERCRATTAGLKVAGPPWREDRSL